MLLHCSSYNQRSQTLINTLRSQKKENIHTRALKDSGEIGGPLSLRSCAKQYSAKRQKQSTNWNEGFQSGRSFFRSSSRGSLTKSLTETLLTHHSTVSLFFSLGMGNRTNNHHCHPLHIVWCNTKHHSTAPNPETLQSWKAGWEVGLLRAKTPN